MMSNLLLASLGILQHLELVLEYAEYHFSWIYGHR